MKQTSDPQSNVNILNERLAGAFYTSRRYNPPLIAVAGVGFIAIFGLTSLIQILGEPAPQLLYIGVLTLLFAIAEIPVLALAQQNKGIAANVYATIVGGVFAILIALLWEGFWTIVMLILITAITPAMALRSGMPLKYFWRLVWIFLAAVAGILYANANPLGPRLQNSNSGAIASIVFALATTLLLITIAVISQNRKYRSLQALLLTSFAMIVTIPTVMTAVLSALGAYTNTQTQTYNTLEAIATLKVNQVQTLLDNSEIDTKTLLADSRFTSNALGILTATPDINPILERNFKQIARSRMMDALGAQAEQYSEAMVLNIQGIVVISTNPAKEGSNFQREAFFEKGLLRFYAGFADESVFGANNLMIAAPIFDVNRQDIRGVLVLRSDGSSVKSIMENTPGFSEAETYLVNTQFRAITKTRTLVINKVDTQAAKEAINNNVTGTKAIYENYTGRSVLGYYRWLAPMELAVIAEVPVSFVTRSSVASLTGSALLALFVVAAAITAVVISARAIADPIKALAQTTESFAAGNLSTRAVVDRQDEIGTLSQAYNQMAVQLQEIIGKLEQRVENRTLDLENQTLRLRVAAEIARDAASARDLHELLTQAARLIHNRFGFYHTGIFLLDNDREYAVLVASPTEAGKQMIENGHKLRVGEMGIVGRVASSGEARVALNTGMDAAYFDNPHLPNTKSEMALPLKSENHVIGVLDVQSAQPSAFNDDDIAIMQILTDQLATAIERARLLQAVEANLRELESAYGRFTSENWKKVLDSLGVNKGYRFDSIRVEPVNELPELASTVLKTGTRIISNGSASEISKDYKVAVPIKLRGQTIGVVTLKLKEDYDVNIISTVELATERLAAAMESARLYEEARLRADREQSISRVTSAISASTDYEQILQTTIREIGSILGSTDVAIQILDEPATGKRAEQKEQ